MPSAANLTQVVKRFSSVRTAQARPPPSRCCSDSRRRKAAEAWGEGDPLNERERQVLRLAGEGRSSADIASELCLSQGTVRNYLSEAIGKLGAGNRIEAYRLARQKGWL